MILFSNSLHGRFHSALSLICVCGALLLAGCAQKIDTAEEFVELGRRHERASEFPETIAAYQKALELNDRLSTTWYDLGVAYSAMERFPDAIKAYSKAIELESSMARAYTNRAAVYARLLQFDLAIPDCDRAIALDPNDFLAWRNRGLARHDRGDLQNAIADYDESIRINGRSAQTYHYRGNVFLDRKLWSRALEDFDQALHLDQKMSAAWLSRAIATARLGRVEDAEAAYQKAAELGAKVENVVLADLAPRLNSSGIDEALNQQAVNFVLAELNKGADKVEPADSPWDLRSRAKDPAKRYVIRVLSPDEKESGVRFSTAELQEIQKSDVPTTLLVVKQSLPSKSKSDQPGFKIAKTFDHWKPDLSGMQPLTWSLPVSIETAASQPGVVTPAMP